MFVRAKRCLNYFFKKLMFGQLKLLIHCRSKFVLVLILALILEKRKHRPNNHANEDAGSHE